MSNSPFVAPPALPLPGSGEVRLNATPPAKGGSLQQARTNRQALAQDGDGGHAWLHDVARIYLLNKRQAQQIRHLLCQRAIYRPAARLHAIVMHGRLVLRSVVRKPRNNALANY